MKQKIKKILKEYEGLMWFTAIGMSVGWCFLAVGMSGGRSISELCDAFVNQGSLAWLFVIAWIFLVIEIVSIATKSYWKQGKIYWITFAVVLYGFLLIFVTKWHWSAFLFPAVLAVRLFLPFRLVDKIQEFFPADDVL